jgi:hypothetical protein
MIELKDWLNSINQNKSNIMLEDPMNEKSYLPFIVNKCLSYFPDTLFHSNKMNSISYVNKKMQYDYLLNKITKKSRFSKWYKEEENSRIAIIKQYYGYSTEKAKQVSHLFTKEQEVILKQALQTGGQKPIKHK